MKKIKLLRAADPSAGLMALGTAELTEDMDGNGYGLIVWLGTKDRERAHARAKRFLARVNRETRSERK